MKVTYGALLLLVITVLGILSGLASFATPDGVDTCLIPGTDLSASARSTVSLSGSVNRSDDIDDWIKVRLGPSGSYQITLTGSNATPGANLNLFAYTECFTSPIASGLTGNSINEQFTINVPTNGTDIFYIKVYSYSGSANYQLVVQRIGDSAPISHDSTACYDNDVYWYNSNNQREEKREECGSDGCSNGSCNPPDQTGECSLNSDCGPGQFVGGSYCSGDNLTRDFVTYSCVNPGASNSRCVSEATPQTVEACSFGCNNNRCSAPVCSLDSDCGSATPQGSRFCNGNDAYQTFNVPFCQNPNNDNAACSINTEDRIVEDCEFGCTGGSCNAASNIVCEHNSDCPGERSTRLICQDNDVYESRTYPVCGNARTPGAYCSMSFFNRSFEEDCGESENGLWQYTCSNNDIVRQRPVVERGCDRGSCYTSDQTQTEFIQNCEFGCTSGVCDSPLPDLAISNADISIEVLP